MATIRDVAKQAGVAVCTVSRVLNNSARVLPETREKVLRVMKELDYVPDELSRGVFRKRVGIVAMLIPGIRHMFFGNLAHCIEQELYIRGYKLMLCSTDNTMEREIEYMRMFRSNLVDGVIMGVNRLEDSAYENFQKPMVMLDYRVNDRIPIVACDNEQGASLAAGVFAERGCKRVLQVCFENVKATQSLLRYGRFERDLRAKGIDVLNVTPALQEFDYFGYQALARQLLTDHPDVDGVMATDTQSCAFLQAASRLGRRVPEDLRLVAFDGTYLAHVNTLNMTAITQPLAQMAEKAVETITALIDGKPVANPLMILPVTLTRGDTA